MNISNRVYTAALKSQLKSFKFKFIFSTEVISYCILVPLLTLYVYTNLNLSMEQMVLLAKVLATIVPISIITTVVSDYIYLSPVTSYFNKAAQGIPSSEAEMLRAYKRFLLLPRIHGIGSFIRWIFGLSMCFVPFTLLGNLSYMQTINLWLIVPVISPYGGILYFFLSEIFNQKLLNEGLFRDMTHTSVELKINFISRIVYSIFIMISIPIIGIIGHFLMNMEQAGILSSVSYTKLIGIIIFGLSVAVSLLTALSKAIKDKIKIIYGHVDHMGEGILDSSSIIIAVTDDLTEIYSHINIMRDKITDIINDINTVSLQQKNSADEISGITQVFANETQDQAAIVEEVMATIEEMSAEMNLVSSGANEQLTGLNALITAMKNLADIINEMEIKIQNTLSQTRHITDQARTGEMLLHEMNDSMNNIGVSSQLMSNIVNIINDISDRINLLSLNASIEAARAGDAGKGFAVVAEEISKLADNTATSVSEIDSLIKTSEEEIKKGTNIARDVVESISGIINGVNVVDDMVNSVTQFVQEQIKTNTAIENEIKNVQLKSENIDHAVMVQKTAMEEVTRSVSRINEISQSISAGSQEIAESTRKNAENASLLKNKVDFFKIKKQ